MENPNHIAEGIPQTEAAYLKFRRLLFGALGKLARQGFVVSPAEGVDLIQDFFAEAWGGISSRYDPSKGKLETYVYEAFVRFARPRIVRLHRWQSYLVDTVVFLRAVEGQSAATEARESEHDIRAAREALLQLPSFEREVLYSCLLADAHSERKLAEQFSISRYRLRETLVEALGRVAVHLGEPGRIPQRDWQVARALWQEERTIPEAAAHLGQTVPQVRAARSRIATLLVEGLKNTQSTVPIQRRRRTMERRIHTLLEELLVSPGNRQLLAEVRARATEVLDALEHLEFSETLEKQMREGGPEYSAWIAEVYETIAGEEEPSSEDLATMEALFQANEEQKISIGYAFKEALMPDLPGYLQNFQYWFKSLPEVTEDEKKDLCNDPVVQAGMPYAEQLTWYGLTPLTIFYSTEAVSGLITRLMHHRVIGPDPVVIGLARTTQDVPLQQMVFHEMAGMAECSERAAHSLFLWFIDVASYKPFLFRSFEARPEGHGTFSLTPRPNVDSNLYTRWGVATVFK
jgi:RNA polymerase sigma factor (sigma-70 family)